MESSNSIFGRSTNTSQAKPLNTTFGLLIGTTILITIVVIYGVVKYFDYINFKKTICDQHKTLNDNIDIINKNNELLSNKKTQLSGHLSKTHENTNCVGEWSNCDLDNCTKTYSVKMPKSGKGKDCDYSDGQKLQCSDGDSGDCRPKDCVGNWSECSDDIRTYTITSEGNSLGSQCPAANGAIDRTTCKTDTLTESEIDSEIKSEVESEIKSEVDSGVQPKVQSGSDTTNFTFQNLVESILDIFFSKN
tara:strand:+ start:4973 stop:5716 length:744 start_codon:yes stop_codon:yes gene_type:complete